ncbi:MAG TPA: DUF1343 domain-containing protein [Terriglobales bacterium]|nr:DUF1343 domain-containing protein [Terriglobales bacterium]
MNLVECASGLDRLVEKVPAWLRGAKVGLVANPASVDSLYVHSVDRIAACTDLRLVAVFGPQHGARGDQQDNMIESEHAVDTRFGVPVYSLYSEHRKPTPEMLTGLDVLICDLPDVGCRPYTFFSTMLLSMQACAEQGKRVVVLDRPNPIGGLAVEGNLLDPAFRSFIGMVRLPMRHGLTLGELAELVNREQGIGAELNVMEMRGWRRELWQDETTVSWVMPSPNMPSVATAAVYPGTVLIEGTNLSEGRGTCRPFELIGAPFLNGDAFACRLNQQGLSGVCFRPAWFRPTFDKWQGELCGGVQVHVTDRDSFRPFRTGLAILKAAMELGGANFCWRQPPFEYEWQKLPIDILCGTDKIRIGLEEGERIADLEATWKDEMQDFLDLRQLYLRY